MNKNLDLVAKELYPKLSNYSNLTMVDAEGNDVDVKDIEAARKFNFEYGYKERNLATITISLNDEDEEQEAFEVLISNDPSSELNDYAKKLFLSFGREMREFAKQHMLTFNIHVATKSNKEKDIGESIMSESKLFGTSKTSYQRIGEATLIIKHRDFVNQENPAGRTQRIESIYLENSEGERFKYPHRHLNGARALAQHVAHGGTPYDNIGQYMIGLSEELSRLRMFKSYVERNDTISEAMGSIHNKVLERIEQVKKEIQHLQRPAHYAEFAESFTESQSIEIPEDIMNDWIDRLTIRTFNEELKNVFPYIFKLVSEDDIPVKELSVEDLVDEDTQQEFQDGMADSVVPELNEYEQYLNQIIEAEQEGIFAAENKDAIAELNELLASPLTLGVDGTNIEQSLEGLGFDEDFINGLKEMAKDDAGQKMDARPLIKEYVKEKDEELGTDISSQLTFGEEQPAPEVPVEPAPEAPAPSEPAPEVHPSEEPQPAPVAEAMMKEERNRMFNELKEFIMSMYNEDEGNFPKGIEGVKIACEKKFGDRVGPIAAKIVERMTSMGEMARMKKLSGMEEGFGDDVKKGIKKLSRGMKGWGTFDKDGPKELVKRNKEHDDETVKLLSKSTGKPTPHSPADLQKRVLDREMKKRGLSNEDSELSAMLRIAGLRMGEMDRLKKLSGLSKEGVAEDPLSELSKGTLEKYKSKAKAQAKNARYYANYGDPDDPQDVKDQYHQFADKREAGAKKADSRLKKEDNELTSMLRIAGLR